MCDPREQAVVMHYIKLWEGGGCIFGCIVRLQMSAPHDMVGCVMVWKDEKYLLSYHRFYAASAP